MTGIPIKTFYESDQTTWSYQSTHVDGASRFITVRGLLALTNAEFSLWEYRDLDWNNVDGQIPEYVAISHTWNSSPEVIRLGTIANRPLHIDMGEASPSTISWHGLRQAALAARHLGCELLWLDFICVHQNSLDDKKLQIPNMGNIYKNATAVIVMLGGVSAAQDFEIETEWATRAWTVQEAALCPNTYVLGMDYVWLLRRKVDDYLFTETSAWPSYREFTYIEDSLALADIRGILNHLQGEVVRKGTWALKCLGDGAVVWAFAALLLATTPTMRQVGVWRSLWLRKSKYPQDTVYSMMHLLGVQIEVDYNRSREDLIAEVVRKTSTSFPSWLDIMEHGAPRELRQSLFPTIPTFDPVPVEKYILTQTYMKTFNIKILIPAAASSDNSDLVCTEIFEIQNNRANESLVINGHGEACHWNLSNADSTHVMLIGAEDFIIPTNGLIRHLAAYEIKKSKSGAWECFPGHGGVPKEFVGKTRRSHLRIGGSPGSKITECDCADGD
ncbi:heterokaryon incompatibility protein domain-containing protein [Trichoderma afarasin]